MVGMALRAGLVLRDAERPEGHALVELDVVADHRRLADDHAGAVVDAEALADGRARMDVDAGARVGDLGQQPGQDGDALGVELVRDPVDRGGEEARIRGDHLVDALRRRIARDDRVGVKAQPVVDPRKSCREVGHDVVDPARVDERLEEAAEVAPDEGQAGLQLVGRRGISL